MLAAPFLPPRWNSELERPEFREHKPETVMIGKCVRAVSGFRAALALADSGYMVECTSIMRMVSDFCDEVRAIGMGMELQREEGQGGLPKSVRHFVDRYFFPTPITPEHVRQAKEKRPRSPRREDLIKAQAGWAEAQGLDGHKMRECKAELDRILNAYVHGDYETTMELYDPRTRRFRMRGSQLGTASQHHVNTMHRMLHTVVGALEITAALTSHAEVFQETRETRHALDKAGWSVPPTGE